MIRIPFAGGHYEGRSKHINAQECMNFYPEVSDQETKGETTLHATPGLDIIDSSNLGSGPIRAMLMHKKDLFVVSGNTLYRFQPISGKINSNVTPSNEGTIATSTGFVSMASSGQQGGQLAIADGAGINVWEDDSVGGIEEATEANPAVVTSTGHGLKTGNKVTIDNLTSAANGGPGWDTLDGNEYSITVLTSNTFELDGLDTSTFDNYTANTGDWDKTHFISVGEDKNTTATAPANFQNVDFNSGQAWSNPGNAAANDDSWASVDFGDGSTGFTDYLVSTMGSNAFSIAAGSTVVGLVVIAEFRTQNKSGPVILQTGFVVTGGVVTEHSFNTTTVTATADPGNVEALGNVDFLPTDSEGNFMTLSSIEVNAGNFGVAFRGSSGSAETGELEIDYITVNVYYVGSSVSSPEYIVWVDNNFLSNSGSTGEFFQTTQALKWNLINFATAERNPDNLKAIVINHREVWLLGDTSTEVWYNSGEDFPFDPIPNVFSEWGIVAPFSAARAGKNVLWLSRNKEGGGQVVMSKGYDVSPVSTPQIDWIIGKYDTISDATAYTMQISGHLWYVLSFPTAKATWVFDLTTGAWFRWGSGGSKSPSGEGSSQPPSRHRGHTHAFDGRDHFLGDWENGNLYKVNVDTFEDNSNPIYRVRTSQRVHGDTFGFASRGAAKSGARNRVSFHAVEIEVNTGADVLGDFTTESEERSRVGLSWSDDNGFTFTDTIWRYVEQTGKEGLRLRWQQLGSSRERIFRLETDTNRDIVIVDANINATVGGN